MPFFPTLTTIIAIDSIRAPVLPKHSQQLLLWYEHWTNLLQNPCILAGILKINLFFVSSETLISNNENVVTDQNSSVLPLSNVLATEKYFCPCTKWFFNYFRIKWRTSWGARIVIYQHRYGKHRKCNANKCILVAKMLFRGDRSKGALKKLRRVLQLHLKLEQHSTSEIKVEYISHCGHKYWQRVQHRIQGTGLFWFHIK